MPSFILIHPTIWPQYTNVTDRTGEDRQTDRQTTDREHRANGFTNGRPKKTKKKKGKEKGMGVTRERRREKAGECDQCDANLAT